jgi:hypothetical protein
VPPDGVEAAWRTAQQGGGRMTDNVLPQAYRWFVAKGLTNWEPWYFVDQLELSDTYLANFSEVFKVETRADFDVQLFARRQDQDDFAFFVSRNGVIEDRVVTIHLAFCDRFELREPLRYTNVTQTFLQWIRDTALADVADWISEEDMFSDL